MRRSVLIAVGLVTLVAVLPRAAAEEPPAASAPKSKGTPMKVGIVYDDAFLAHRADDHHPERPERLKAIASALKEAGLWGDLFRVEPRAATNEDLLRVHTRAHIEEVRETAEAGRPVWFGADTYTNADSWKTARLAAGGACAAVDAVMNGDARAVFCAVRPPGHHATESRAMGFCLFNNVAVAARHAQAKHGVKRVLIVDFDVHHGNGTQAIFEADPTVVYVSTHQSPLYPGTGHAAEKGRGKGEDTVFNRPLAPGTGDEGFLAALKGSLDEAAKSKPQLVFISAGFDAHRDDPLAGLRVTEEGFAEATRLVRTVAEEHAEGRIVVCLEGGYHLKALGASVVAHVKALAESPKKAETRAE